MYRKTIITIWLTLLSFALFSQKYKLNVKLEGLKATFGNFVTYNPNIAEGIKFERVPVDGDHYTIEGECDFPLMTSIVFDDDRTMKLLPGGFIPCKSALLWVVIEPDKTVDIEGKMTTFHNVYVKDGGENQKLSEINRRIMPLFDEWGDLQVRMRMDTTLSDEEKNEMTEKVKVLDVQVVNIQKEMIGNDPSSVAALWMLDEMFTRNQVTTDEVAHILKSVDEKYKDHPYYLTLLSKMDGAKNAIVGKSAPEIKTKNTVDGNEFNLSDLKGKYVILDFWGTWCGPCMAGMPRMKELRERYKDKLVLVGIAEETNIDNWRSVIKEKNLDWQQIHNGVKDENFVVKYNITGFPTKILISPGGVILYRVVNETDEFYDQVAKFME